MQTAHVKIDKTAPTISHTFTPLSYTERRLDQPGRHRDLHCADQGGSGVAGCTAPVTKIDRGREPRHGHRHGRRRQLRHRHRHRAASTRPSRPSPRPRPAPRTPPAGTRTTSPSAYTANDALSGVAGTATEVLGEGANQSASAHGHRRRRQHRQRRRQRHQRRQDRPGPDRHVHRAAGTPATSPSPGPAPTPCPARPVSPPTHRRPARATTCPPPPAAPTSPATPRPRRSPASRSTAPHRPRPARPAPQASGWYGGAVEVTLTGQRQPVRRRRDLLHGRRGDRRPTAAPSPSAPRASTRSPSGARTAPATSRTAGAPLTLKIDKTAPTTTVINPISPASGWFVTSGIPFAFDANGRRVRHRGDLLHDRRWRRADLRRAVHRRTCPPVPHDRPTGASTSPATPRPAASTRGEGRHDRPDDHRAPRRRRRTASGGTTPTST